MNLIPSFKGPLGLWPDLARSHSGPTWTWDTKELPQRKLGKLFFVLVLDAFGDRISGIRQIKSSPFTRLSLGRLVSGDAEFS